MDIIINARILNWKKIYFEIKYLQCGSGGKVQYGEENKIYTHYIKEEGEVCEGLNKLQKFKTYSCGENVKITVVTKMVYLEVRHDNVLIVWECKWGV